jgi:uridine phosphorylase
MPIAKSELILNDDGSVYHLNLHPGDLAETIITVGDQERVEEVSKFFDSVDLKKQKREFSCHTGFIGKKRLSVISTGIGTDNIDIVFNEIDALFNVDLNTREVKEEITILDFIRLGTSGSLQVDIPLGQFLISELAVGIDNMNQFYKIPQHFFDAALDQKFRNTFGAMFNSYTVKSDPTLKMLFDNEEDFINGKTLTSIGFYAPQGRSIRNNLLFPGFIDQMASLGISNLEMETSGIYLLAANLGHRALSINAILANRQLGTFEDNPGIVVDRMIRRALEVILRD